MLADSESQQQNESFTQDEDIFMDQVREKHIILTTSFMPSTLDNTKVTVTCARDERSLGQTMNYSYRMVKENGWKDHYQRANIHKIIYKEKAIFRQKIIDQPLQIKLSPPKEKEVQEQFILQQNSPRQMEIPLISPSQCKQTIQSNLAEDIIPFVQIDFNPKTNIKKSNKQKFLINQRQEQISVLSEGSQRQHSRDQDSFSRPNNGSSLYLEKTIFEAYSTLTSQANVSSSCEFPFKQIELELESNQCVMEVKIKKIVIIPLNKEIKTKRMNEHDRIIEFKTCEYTLPKQYRVHVKNINFCWLRVPKMLDDLGTTDELGSKLLRVAEIRLTCSNCFCKNTASMKGELMQKSCVNCSYKLSIKILKIRIGK